MSADWREAIRGVPLWTGAAVNDTRGPGYGGGIVTGIDGDQVEVNDAWCPVGQFALDLEHAPTRRNFDAELALALGAPPEAVDEGVVFFSEGESWGWSIGAGADPEGDFRWTESFMPATKGATDPLLARALAWPAGKRVSR